ncbi:MAG: hypothetical protein AAGM38_14070 [Pseudomonadota bacterium]
MWRAFSAGVVGRWSYAAQNGDCSARFIDVRAKGSSITLFDGSKAVFSVDLEAMLKGAPAGFSTDTVLKLGPEEIRLSDGAAGFALSSTRVLFDRDGARLSATRRGDRIETLRAGKVIEFAKCR